MSDAILYLLVGFLIAGVLWVLTRKNRSKDVGCPRPEEVHRLIQQGREGEAIQKYRELHGVSQEAAEKFVNRESQQAPQIRNV